MIKRLTWFVGGAMAGVAGTGLAKRKVKHVATQLAPRQVASGMKRRVSDAVAEGRRAMRAREAELRARLDGRAVSLADHVQPGDEVLVDGQPVEPGQVIVLRQVADSARRRKRA